MVLAGSRGGQIAVKARVPCHFQGRFEGADIAAGLPEGTGPFVVGESGSIAFS